MATAVHSTLAAFADRAEPPAGVAWFVEGVIEPGRPIAKYEIGATNFRIGRDRTADLPIPSRLVSKAHAEVIVAGNTAFVRDSGSTNGTFVNGRRIPPDEPTPIGTADLLQFADVEFRVGRVLQNESSATFVEATPESGWLISGLTELVENERLHMVFQPIVDIKTGARVASEALVRSDVKGLENPATIFSAAAQIGWSDRVSELCRITAIETLLTGGCRRPLFLYTDPSEELGEQLLNSMRRLRRVTSDLPIVLELHEEAVPNSSALGEFKAALADIDIQIAYDDFGAGQSRLLELAQVPPDYLKFDRSLLQDIDEASSGHRMLLGTLVAAMREAGVMVLAEGLERIEEVEVCREMGFELAQGYYFGRPMPFEDLPPA